jgi:hypothetical protein
VQRLRVLVEDAAEHDECRHQQRVARSDPERRGLIHLRQDVRVLERDELQRQKAEEILLRGLLLRAEHLEFVLKRRRACGHSITLMGQPKYEKRNSPPPCRAVSLSLFLRRPACQVVMNAMVSVNFDIE